MTPQQRHRDEARKMLSTLVPFSEWCPPWEEAVSELALALADAENRAAWDGFERGREYQRSDATYEETAILRGMDDIYGGPRQSRGEVGNE